MHIKLSKLKQGPIQNEVLPNGFIGKVMQYKEILKEVETSSLEEAINNFQKDLHPERELLLWQSIARCYEAELIRNPTTSLGQKKGLFKSLLAATLI